jgi:4-amino-4-deoxy-L-arabinose transferase-like glycosyltransferase
MRLAPEKALHAAIWAYTGFHLLIAVILPLAAHEAHYAVYARHLALSYLDHPPLAAWLQSLVLMVSNSDFALRLLPIVLSVAAMYLLATLSRRVHPQGSPWLPVISVLLVQGAIVFHGSMTLSPDAPLLPLALGVVLVTLSLRADLETGDGRGSLAGWLLLGVLIGLAGLAKYTAVTLPLSVLGVLILSRGLRALTLPGLWLAGSVAVLLVSPVLIWNWQNDWATVRFHTDYQFEDIERWSLAGFLASSAGQFVYYSPLVILGGAAALVSGWRRWRGGRLSRQEGVLTLFVLPVLGLYLMTALESRASPHWSMLGWLFLVPLTAAWVAAGWQASRGVRWLTGFSAATSVAATVALLVLVLPIGTWPDFRHPARLVVGWQAATDQGAGLLETLPDQGFTSEPMLLARNWHHAGLLEWYAEGVPLRNLFHDLNPSSFRNGLSDASTWGVLIYPWDSLEPRLENLTRDFDCSPLEAMPARHGSNLVQVFHFYACYSRMPGSPIAN